MDSKIHAIAFATLYAKRHGLDEIKAGRYAGITYRIRREAPELSVSEIEIILKMVHLDSHEND